MLEAGRPTISKRFITKETSTSVAASDKSSKATKFFSKMTKRTFKKAVRTPTGYPFKNFRWTQTTSLAKFLGRWTPFVGGSLLVWDAIDLSYKAIQSFTNDSIGEFFDGARKNTTSIGMYHEDDN